MFGSKKKNDATTELSPSYMEAGRDSVTLRDERVNPDAAITKTDLEKNMKRKKEADALNGDVAEAEITERAAEDEGEINYHVLHWWQVALLMIAETISLGILSLPSVFATVGMPGGILLILGLGLLATYTGYNIGLFKLAYPHVQNQADAGEVLGGPILREILGGAQIVFLTFICGSHVLTGLIALETIANDNVCTVVWAVIIAVVSCILTFPRTFTKISYFSVVSFISIVAAVTITMIGVGVNPRMGVVTAKAAPGTTFRQGFTAATNVIFAYAGHAAFFNFISEMKKPSDYDKALYLLQATDISMYLIVGIVVYYYVGDTATSPALGNLPLTLSRIAYGVAIPTILIAGVINGSVAAKLAMQRIFRPTSPHVRNNTKLGWAVWSTIVISIWALAFIIANVIPFFNQLLGVISALFASIFTYGISGVFWLYLNPRRTWFQNKKMTAMTCLNMFIIVFAAVVMGCGLYASIAGIVDGYRSGEFGSPFSCASRA